jgi:hypothetical protein
MADKAKNPTLELLWAVHADIAAVKDKVTEVLTQLRIHGTQIAALVQRENLTSARIAELDVRLSNVEKRLDELGEE